MSRTKIEFLSPCPGRGCSSPASKVYRWVHANCDGTMGEWLDNQANIICKDCGRNFFILDASFACEYHENDYREAGYTELTNAISVLISNPEVNESDLQFLMLVSQRIKARAREKGII